MTNYCGRAEEYLNIENTELLKHYHYFFYRWLIYQKKTKCTETHTLSYTLCSSITSVVLLCVYTSWGSEKANLYTKGQVAQLYRRHVVSHVANCCHVRDKHGANWRLLNEERPEASDMKGISTYIRDFWLGPKPLPESIDYRIYPHSKYSRYIASLKEGAPVPPRHFYWLFCGEGEIWWLKLPIMLALPGSYSTP